MNRREFSKGCVAAASAMALHQAMGQRHAPTGDLDLDARQSEIDVLAPKAFVAYWTQGLQMKPEDLSACVEKFPVLKRLEAAFEKVFREAKV